MNFLIILLFFIYFYENNAETKHCDRCSNFIPYKNNKIAGLGRCKLFGDKISSQKYASVNEQILYNFADHCRKDEHLCGKEGWLYEENINIVKTDEHRAKEKIFQYYRFLQIIKENW
jgi:hypothetical protein